jgi:hypothetical protein
MLDDAVDCKIILVAAVSKWRPFLDSVPVFDGRWIKKQYIRNAGIHLSMSAPRYNSQQHQNLHRHDSLNMPTATNRPNDALISDTGYSFDSIRRQFNNWTLYLIAFINAHEQITECNNIKCKLSSMYMILVVRK